MTPRPFSAMARKHSMRYGLIPLLGLACALCGCQSFTNPFVGPPPAYKAQYGLTPRQKIQRLEQLALQLPSKPAAEQQTLAQELTATLSKEQDPLLRKALVSALGSLIDPDSNPTLLAAINDPSPHVRAAACQAWGKRPSDEAINVLSRALQDDEDADVRLAAVVALGQIRSPRSFEVLASALDSTDPALQMAAMRSLRTATGQALGNDVNAWHRYLASQSTIVGRPLAAKSPVIQATAKLPAQ